MLAFWKLVLQCRKFMCCVQLLLFMNYDQNIINNIFDNKFVQTVQ